MEGEVGEKKIEELAFLFDFAFNNQWLFNELYDNYPFPGTNSIPDRLLLHINSVIRKKFVFLVPFQDLSKPHGLVAFGIHRFLE